ncbi:MAG TPA: hypothetical protein PKY25_03120 [Bacilli bacterium]|nr:hypothetical protein [Bacilli bacterium]
MIHKREFEYVGRWARDVDYPPNDYILRTQEELERVAKLFDEQYKKIKYSICFSNSTELELEILEKNVAHMLGIDYKNLNSAYHSRFRQEVLDIDPSQHIKSYTMLKKMVETFSKMVDFERRTGIKILNYYTVQIKCAIFEKILDLSKFNYGCINFDKEEFNRNSSKPFSGNSEKFLFVESGETNAPYFLMGILPNNESFRYGDSENGNGTENGDISEEEVNNEYKSISYAVETLIAPLNPECFIKNQEVIIPTHLLYSKNNQFTKLEASPEQKLALLKMYRCLIENYGFENKINILGDYSLILSDQVNKIKKLV